MLSDLGNEAEKIGDLGEGEVEIFGEKVSVSRRHWCPRCRSLPRTQSPLCPVSPLVYLCICKSLCVL